jgi:predicted nucleic acid-binding protein
MAFIYIDSNVFIAAFEAQPDVAAPAQSLIASGRNSPYSLVTSELTIAEVMAPAAAPGSLPIHKKRQIYQTVLLWSGFVRLVPVSRDILLATAPLRDAHRQKLPDAIHIATALRSGCQYFCSSDRDARRLPAGLTLLVPDRANIATLLAALTQ